MGKNQHLHIELVSLVMENDVMHDNTGEEIVINVSTNVNKMGLRKDLLIGNASIGATEKKATLSARACWRDDKENVPFRSHCLWVGRPTKRLP